MLEWIGHFHPVLVHLPIGILLIAFVLQWLLGREPHRLLHKAFLLTLLLGVLSAAFSCLTGYLLSLSGDYDRTLVHQHMYMAFALTVISLLWLWRGRKQSFLVPTGSEPSAVGRRLPWTDRILSLTVLVVLMITGHLGGTLTHGEGYLTPHWGEDASAGIPLLKPIADVNNTVVYTGMVQPILHDYCYRCHGPSTQKGGLRMDSPDLLMKGGKHGKVIDPGQASASELIKRILLPSEDEHHMAPKEKSQLTKEQIRLLSWWIDAGAPMDKKAGELAQDSSIKVVLEDFHKGSAEVLGKAAKAANGTNGANGANGANGTKEANGANGEGDADEGPKNVADSDMPAQPVSPASTKVIKELSAEGVSVLPIALGSNYLEVTLPQDSTIKPETFKKLADLKDQLVILKATGVNLGNDALTDISRCTQLIRLRLDHATFGSEGLKPLITLQKLRYLNLVGTAVTQTDVLALKGLSNLKVLYLFQTKVDKAGWVSLARVFPQTKIDSGGYMVPLLTTDTQIVKAPVRPQ
jgi:uncharacterized membrane protein